MGLDVTDEWGQAVPVGKLYQLYNLPPFFLIVLQIAPIDYGSYVTTCPYKYYMYIYIYIERERYLDQNWTHILY